MSHDDDETEHSNVGGGGRSRRPPRPAKRTKKNSRVATTAATTTATKSAPSSASSSPILMLENNLPSPASTATSATAWMSPFSSQASRTGTITRGRIPVEASEWMSVTFGIDPDLCTSPSLWKNGLTAKQLRDIYDALQALDAVRDKDRTVLKKRATKPVMIREIQMIFYVDEDGTVVDGSVLQALRLGIGAPGAQHHDHCDDRKPSPRKHNSTAAATTTAGPASPPLHQPPQFGNDQDVGATAAAAAYNDTAFASAPNITFGRSSSGTFTFGSTTASQSFAANSASGNFSFGSSTTSQPFATNSDSGNFSFGSTTTSQPFAANPNQPNQGWEQNQRAAFDGAFASAPAAAPGFAFGQSTAAQAFRFAPHAASNSGAAPSAFDRYAPQPAFVFGVGMAASDEPFVSTTAQFGNSAATASAATTPNSHERPPRANAKRPPQTPTPPPPPAPPTSHFGAMHSSALPTAPQATEANPFVGGTGFGNSTGGTPFGFANTGAANGAAAVYPTNNNVFGASGGDAPFVFGQPGPAASLFGGGQNHSGRNPLPSFTQPSSQPSGNPSGNGGPTAPGANSTAASANPDTTPQNAKEATLLAALIPLGFRNPAELLVSIRKLVSARGEAQVTADDVMCDVVQAREEAEFARQMDLARLASERDRRTDSEVRRKANALAFDERILAASVADWIDSKDMFQDSWLLKSSCRDSLLSHVNDEPTELKKHLVEILKLEKKSRQWYGQELPSYFFDGVLAEKLRTIKDGTALEIALQKEVKCLRDGLMLLSNQEGSVPQIFIEAKEEWKRRYGEADNGSDDDEVILLETRRPSEDPHRAEIIETS